jgi:hypothetical protein
MLLWILGSSAAATILWLLFWMVVTHLVGRSARQTEFVAGVVPSSPPDGFYRGSAYLVGNRRVPWLGKSFESQAGLGFNTFTPRGASLLRIMTPLYNRFRVNADGDTDAYYFKTCTGPGYRDTNLEVFKLDYASPENPFLIRIILDEMVETAPDTVLGKVHMKVFPGYFATIGFFGLRRDDQG